MNSWSWIHKFAAPAIACTKLARQGCIGLGYLGLEVDRELDAARAALESARDLLYGAHPQIEADHEPLLLDAAIQATVTAALEQGCFRTADHLRHALRVYRDKMALRAEAREPLFPLQLDRVA